MPKRIRAAAIVLHENKLLATRRTKPGKDYYIFPGGGVENGESVEQAVLRELLEETCIKANIDRLLYHHIYDDDTEHYFYLCSYLSGTPACGDGPEFQHPDPDNVYVPGWVDRKELPHLLLYPLEIRDWLIEDLRENFVSVPREATLRLADRRETL